MANEYKEAFECFKQGFEPKDVSHSGVSLYASDVYEWLEHDEADAEESFSNYLDSEGLELLVSLEDCCNGIDLEYVLENQAHDSFVNGQKEQFVKQYSNLCPVEFETFIEQNLTETDQLKICKYIILNCF